jgi:DNA-binding protein HU-beta
MVKKIQDQELNKSQLVSVIAEKNGMTKVDAEKALEITVGGILEAMSQGYGVSLIGFGAFYIHSRPSRMGRNPKTGEPIKIEAYNQVIFKPGKTMKDSCN